VKWSQKDIAAIKPGSWLLVKIDSQSRSWKNNTTRARVRHVHWTGKVMIVVVQIETPPTKNHVDPYSVQLLECRLPESAIDRLADLVRG